MHHHHKTEIKKYIKARNSREMDGELHNIACRQYSAQRCVLLWAYLVKIMANID
jgi:hypothetical protein